jgi:hypothetical protein
MITHFSKPLYESTCFYFASGHKSAGRDGVPRERAIVASAPLDLTPIFVIPEGRFAVAAVFSMGDELAKRYAVSFIESNAKAA